MFIECYGDYTIVGRISDVFYIEGVESLEELQEIIKSKTPIECWEPTMYDKGRIAYSEGLRKRIVYLNNYMKIKQRHFYLLDQNERKEIENKVCKTCKCNDGSFTGALSCNYHASSNEGCLNYEKSLYASAISWLKGGKSGDKT
ncbi:hypothetical protein [Paenibacillus sp. NAIST15-1]|uniref:hypothetical protein n=1 Tax=Paenibacillus sp. NAIST15-1 TaxID=1605994 RepID=UPI00086B04E7|nr:hypothetical protein [Paenibacillus sp. NAIST15-1]GAV11464.1 chlorite dismutase [Paenibacillus sp. NAIST15-1]